MHYYLTLSLTIILLITSCKNPSSNEVNADNNDGLKVKVTKSAGDYFSQEATFVALPFNIAKNNGLEYVILSQRIASGDMVNINPIGMASILENGVKKNIIIALPTDTQSTHFDSASFNDFATQYASTLQAIEHYLVNRTGQLTSNHLISWYDENHTKKYIMSETNSKKN